MTLIPFLISGIGLALAIVLYHKDPRRLVFRILPLVLIFLVLARFSIGFRRDRKPNPPLVLIDASASFRDFIPLALQCAADFKFPHALAFFAESIFLEPPDSAAPAGRYTNITRAIAEAQGRDPSQIILISDGNHNYGDPPGPGNGVSRVPVNVIAAGAEQEKNAAITDVDYPQFAYAGDSLRISVELVSEGFGTGTGWVVLKVPGANFQSRKSFPLGALRARIALEFMIPQSRAGQNAVTVDIMPQPGETSSDDNHHAFSVKTLARTVSVLYFTDHLSFNTRFFLEGLGSIENISLAAFCRLGASGFRDIIADRDTGRIPDPSRFDVIVLDNARYASGLPLDLAAALERGTGIMIAGSCESVSEANRNLMPISVSGNQIAGSFPVRVTADFSDLRSGRDYPPFRAVNRVIGAKEDATIIAESNKIPIMAYRHQRQGRIFQINALDIGSWGFSQNALQGGDVFARLISDIISFLSPAGRENRLVLRSFTSKYALGEPVTLKLESYGQNMRPKSGGDFYAVIGKRMIPFFESAPGSYEASFTAETAGDLTVSAFGVLEGDSLKSNGLPLVITGGNAETKRSVNRSLLLSLAATTGGRFIELDQVKDFRLPTVRPETVTRTFNLDHPLVYFAVFALAAADWVLRRRSGML